MLFGNCSYTVEEGENYVFKFNCAGYGKDDLEIKLDGRNRIKIFGNNDECGKFTETIFVDALKYVDTSDMTAVVKNGIIKFILPKKKEYSQNIKIV